MKTRFKTWFQLSGHSQAAPHRSGNGRDEVPRERLCQFRTAARAGIPHHVRGRLPDDEAALLREGAVAADRPGPFAGIFKFFKDGRDWSGTFSSDEAGTRYRQREWRFPKLHGALSWTPKSFVVSHADSEFLGGSMRLNYSLAPLGTKEGANATLGATYQDVDLYRFTRQVGFTSLEPLGGCGARCPWAGTTASSAKPCRAPAIR